MIWRRRKPPPRPWQLPQRNWRLSKKFPFVWSADAYIRDCPTTSAMFARMWASALRSCLLSQQPLAKRRNKIGGAIGFQSGQMDYRPHAVGRESRNQDESLAGHR